MNAIDRIRAERAKLKPDVLKPWVTLDHLPYIHATDDPNAKPYSAPVVGRFDYLETAEYILACNPAAMAEVLTNIDAQAQEIAELTTALANCRNAFPPPEVGTDLETLWACAMSRVECVADYVVAAEKSQQRLIRGYVDDKRELEERVAGQAQEIERLRTDSDQMLKTLTGIRDANPRAWEECSCEFTEFERWAKSRANHSILKNAAMKESP